MDYKALTLEEVTKALLEGTVEDIWYAEMKRVIGGTTDKFVALRPLEQANIKDLLKKDMVFFKINEKAEVDITKRI